ncbi:hypothetical protein C8F04DRAFT_1273776 [Mycena alexandri]|uniref:Uncharacterized protein n=1 Tax=Mycena alexandri TaxID=1745969 RepID=A0AAD6S580_9AGAR|nr:hypothetical protein C8F04DRAFT_1273776 [Mycena alexandri]
MPRKVERGSRSMWNEAVDAEGTDNVTVLEKFPVSYHKETVPVEDSSPTLSSYPDLVPLSPNYILELTTNALRTNQPLCDPTYSPSGTAVLITPHGETLRTLRGASSLEKLQIMWTCLGARVDIARTRFKQYEQEYQKQKNEETYKSSLPITRSSLRPSAPLASPTPLASPAPLVSSASPPSTSTSRTRTPEPTRKALSAFSRSGSADPPERSPSAVGPSVRALVASIESALDLERGAATLNETAPRARSVESTRDSGGRNVWHSACELLDALSGRHPTSTSSPGSAGVATVVTAAVERGGQQSESAKSSAVLKDQVRLTSRDFDKNNPGLTPSLISSSRPSHRVNVAPNLLGIRCKSGLRDNALGKPQSKFPAPAPAIADAVELGGLNIETAETRARASTVELGGLNIETAETRARASAVERGVRMPATLTRKPNAGWKAWQAAEARLARVQIATKTSA